jgi:hypothetical protein
VATTFRFNGFEPEGLTSPRTKAPPSAVSVRGMRTMRERAMVVMLMTLAVRDRWA